MRGSGVRRNYDSARQDRYAPSVDQTLEESTVVDHAQIISPLAALKDYPTMIVLSI